LLANSILFGNQEGSLSGLEDSQVFSNLIGDRKFQGVNGNFFDDPLLADPQNGLFSPLAGSPVIDAGDNSLSREHVDIFSHQRKVDGTGDGVAIVDLGAIEYASEFSIPKRLPILTLQPEQWFGIAVANSETFPGVAEGSMEGPPSSANMLFRAHDTEGREIGSRNVTVPRHNQASWLATELFDELKEGWIELLPTGPDALSFALMGNWETSILDGVPLSSDLAERIVFPEIRNSPGESTTLFLLNPNDSEISVVLTWKHPNNPDLEVTQVIPAEGMLKTSVGDLFGTGTGGYIIVESQGEFPIYGMELFGTVDTLGALVGLDAEDGKRELFAAQMVYSESVSTILNVVNLDLSTAEITLDAVSEQGSLLATKQLELIGGAQLRTPARELFGFDGQVEGWIRISSSSQLAGALSFEDPYGKWLASLPLQSESARELILSHVAHDSSIFTGITLLNSNSREALISFEILDKTGRVSGSVHFSLPAQSKRAQLLNEWIPGFEEQLGGMIRVRSNLGIFGFELFGSYDLDYVAAVPQQVTTR
jgi:hypothetical protein